MFGSKKSDDKLINDFIDYKVESTVISSNSQFEGNIITSGIMRIDGSVSGEINSDGHVIIGESGSVKDRIKASRITVSGKIEGNVICNGTLEMTKSGILNADIEVGNIIIEEGAVFNGKCTTNKIFSK